MQLLTVPLAIPFPAFDPIAISIGPFAIRWYALAYITGILLGWVYARAILKSERAWGGPAPITLPDFDDFVLWITLGIILGGRIGYVLFYNLPHYIDHPIEIFYLWTGGMSFHGGFVGSLLAVILFARNRRIPIMSLGDIICAVEPIGLFLGRHRELHQRRAVGPRQPTCHGRWCFRAPDRCRGIRASSTRPALEGLLLFVVLARHDLRSAR